MSGMKAASVLGLIATMAMTSTAPGQSQGADIKHSGLAGSISKYGPVGGTYAYALGSNTCNVGNASLQWLNHGTPGIAMNAYRLHNGRFMQIGMGNAKTACCVANSSSPLCDGLSCSGSGFGLRPGCMDTYGSGFNGAQGNLAPRSFMHPQTGVINTSYPSTTGDAIFRRMQIAQADMTAANFPGPLYFFVEGHYICTEDAVANNDLNNASYSRVTVDGTFSLIPVTPVATEFHEGTPAIYAWRDQGLGPNTPDPGVTILNIDVPNEGRFILAQKVIDNLNGTWRYEYGIYNFNSDRSGGSFAVPLPAGATVTDIGFNAPNYHSGEIYSNTDWTVANNGFELRWSSPQTVVQNPNTNALRWGSLYNFWFTCDQAPVASQVELDLFKAPVGCQPVKVAAVVNAPASLCTGDAVRSGAVDIDDLLAVIGGWGPCSCQFTCVGDVVANTQVDIDDLLHVVDTWGGCK